MPDLFGRTLTRGEILARVGDVRQVAGARAIELADGRERGVRAVDVRTGSGLRFLVAVERGLDIADATFGDVPLAWISPPGLAHPAYFEAPGFGWLRSFHGGLLATCGLSNVGSPNSDEGEERGLHGRMSNTPARNVCVREEWEGDDYVIAVSGTLREARVFGEDLELRRTIETRLGAREIVIRDRVTNLGSERKPAMLLYHINIGWPVVDEQAELVTAACEDVPRDEDAADGAELARRFQAPTPGYKEKVYYRDVPAGADGFARVGVVNRSLETPLGVAVAFRKRELPELIQWKMMGAGHYVCGIEPANCRVGGRAEERARGGLVELDPGESRDSEVRIEVLDSAEAVDDFASAAAGP